MQNTDEQEIQVTQEEAQVTQEERPADGAEERKKQRHATQEKEIEEQEKKFSPGQKLTFVRVRFPGNAKSHPFLVGDKYYRYGQSVVAMSDRGMTIGHINSFPHVVDYDKSLLPIRAIKKVAGEEDFLYQKENIQREHKAENICLNLIEKYKLNMTLTHVEFIQYGKKAVFYFTAPERVDFRDLVKGLVSELKMRIELRQISVRDRTAALGAIGACGRTNCCSTFQGRHGNVSIKMAKNQSLALIPGKINGVCGQIKCCMKYEDDVYSDKRRRLPREGNFIKVKNGDIGKVLKLRILTEEFDMLTDSGKKRRYYISEYDPKECSPPSSWKFPTSFDHVANELNEVIGKTTTVLEALDTAEWKTKDAMKSNTPTPPANEENKNQGRNSNSRNSNNHNSRRNNRTSSGNRQTNNNYQGKKKDNS